MNATPYAHCGHAIGRHDPEDGSCDAHRDVGLGPCGCRKGLAQPVTPAHLAEAEALGHEPTDTPVPFAGGLYTQHACIHCGKPYSSEGICAPRVLSALASRDEEIARVRGERDEARQQVEQLCAARERVAMLVPLGEAVGTVEEDIAAYVGRLTASLARLREENGRVKGEIARRDYECGRIWYHPHAQEDRVCRLPRGHAPEETEFGCKEAPDEDVFPTTPGAHTETKP